MSLRQFDLAREAEREGEEIRQQRKQPRDIIHEGHCSGGQFTYPR